MRGSPGCIVLAQILTQLEQDPRTHEFLIMSHANRDGVVCIVNTSNTRGIQLYTLESGQTAIIDYLPPDSNVRALLSVNVALAVTNNIIEYLLGDRKNI